MVAITLKTIATPDLAKFIITVFRTTKPFLWISGLEKQNFGTAAHSHTATENQLNSCLSGIGLCTYLIILLFIYSVVVLCAFRF